MILLTLLAATPLLPAQASLLPTGAPRPSAAPGRTVQQRTRAPRAALPSAPGGSSLQLQVPPTTAVRAGAQTGATPVPIPDCNRNGIPDPLEVASGAVADCQADGIPDECQLATELRYRWDDEGMNTAVTFGQPYTAWLAAHTVEAGHEVITEIEVAWGLVPAGSPATLALWSDPTRDNDPSDAVLLMQQPVTTDLEFTGTVLRYSVPPTRVGDAGENFYVGAYGGFATTDFPVGRDDSFASLSSIVVASSTPLQLDDLLGGNPAVFGATNQGDFMLRAISCPGGYCAESQDQDFSGVPDDCELQDCNSNGIPDLNDLLTGTSADCNLDGVPDECQLDTGVVYTDATAFSGAVGTGWDHYAWLTQAVVEPGGEVITEIEIAYGATEAATPVVVGLWSDPDGDGSPADAQLLTSVETLSRREFSGEYTRINIPDLFVGPAGTSFFVGAYGEFPTTTGWFAASFDTTASDQRSWFISADQPLDVNDLSANTQEFGLIASLCSCDGDWMLRAISCTTGHCGEAADLNGNAVPDECDPDCDGDGIPDDYEIQVGTATDCDASGVPDQCESLSDCDENGLPDVCQSTTPTGLSGEYYPNRHLLGTPLSRIDQGVAFDFDANPPFPGQIPPDGFSVRWTGALRTSVPGLHTFGLTHDDGVRLWVNGQLIIDLWESASGQLDLGSIDLPGNSDQYYIVLEYFEGNGNALVELFWQPPGGVLAPLPASNLAPIYDRQQDGIPDSCQVPDCNGNGVDDSEDILFGTSDDLDGDMVPDECLPCLDCDGNRVPDSAEAGLGHGLVGQYFVTSENPPALEQFVDFNIDPVIDFNWGNSGPALLPDNDDFAIRWTGSVTTPAVSGDYTFHLVSDDGVRLWIDGVLLIDEWHPSSGVEYTTTLNLAALSRHRLRIEYYEAGGGALVQFFWTVPGAPKVIVPATALSPSTDIDGDGIPDACAADCDLDGIIDPLEADLDGDCVPDDCQGGTGYWRFEETTGANLTPDSTGNGLDGLVTPTISQRVSDVPVTVIPSTGAANTQSLDLGWADFGTSSPVTVPDTGGLLVVDDGSFTLEAWVRLVSLSSNLGPDDRQWLFQKKPDASPDTRLAFSLLAQAGNFGTGTGRELLFRYGDGATDRNITSFLSIDDLEWHHVSVAYDAPRRQLRFGLDDSFDIRFLEKPVPPPGGSLIVGGHTNGAGFLNQQLRGLVDEVRFTRYFLPVESLLDR